MARTDPTQTTITDLTAAVQPFSVDLARPEGPENPDETTYDFPNFTKWFGYYKKIPELKKPTDALALWTVGKGFDEAAMDVRTRVLLGNIRGWGEDTIKSVLMNMLIIKKINGDAFAEIIRLDGTLVNIKPLDPSKMRIVVDKNGVIKRYEQRDGVNGPKKFQPKQILHLSNDRVADEIHGTSVVEVCEDIILARNEAITDYRKLLHRNIVPVRILEVDTDNTAQIANLKTQYNDAIKKGEVLIVPKGNVEIKDAGFNVHDPTSWIKYLENFFYQALGVPKIILGGSEEFTEASSKIAYLTFEQVYATEQNELEADIFNQLGLQVRFLRPASLKNEVLSSEGKNTGQVGFQPNDTTANSGRGA